MAASLSLTPRETSSGLRKPRLAAPQRTNLTPAAGIGGPVPPAFSRGSSASTVVPTQEALRHNARMLRDRRIQRLSGFDPTGDEEPVSVAIRNRTQLTLAQAHAQPDGPSHLEPVAEPPHGAVEHEQETPSPLSNEAADDGSGLMVEGDLNDARVKDIKSYISRREKMLRI